MIKFDFQFKKIFYGNRVFMCILNVFLCECHSFLCDIQPLICVIFVYLDNFFSDKFLCVFQLF